MKVATLYFCDGISMLEGRKSVATVETSGMTGMKTAESILREDGGFMVGWGGKTVWVPDARVECALLVQVKK